MAASRVEGLSPATRQFLKRLESGGKSPKAATVALHAETLWNDFTPAKRADFLALVREEFQVESQYLAGAGHFGRWLSESVTTRGLVPIQLDLSLDVSIRHNGQLRETGPLRNGCVVYPVIRASRPVFISLGVLCSTGEGVQKQSLYPADSPDIPLPQEPVPTSRLSWKNGICWVEGGEGVVTMIAVAVEQAVLHGAITHAIPEFRPPDLNSVYKDVFERALLKEPRRLPTDFRKFSGEGDDERTLATNWHGWLARTICQALEFTPTAITMQSRPAVP